MPHFPFKLFSFHFALLFVCAIYSEKAAGRKEAAPTAFPAYVNYTLYLIHISLTGSRPAFARFYDNLAEEAFAFLFSSDEGIRRIILWGCSNTGPCKLAIYDANSQFCRDIFFLLR